MSNVVASIQPLHEESRLASVTPLVRPMTPVSWRELEHARAALEQVLQLLGEGSSPAAGHSHTPAHAAVYLAGQVVRNIGVAINQPCITQAALHHARAALDSTNEALSMLQQAAQCGDGSHTVTRQHFHGALLYVHRAIEGCRL